MQNHRPRYWILMETRDILGRVEDIRPCWTESTPCLERRVVKETKREESGEKEDISQKVDGGKEKEGAVEATKTGGQLQSECLERKNKI